jgi:hypothetical protein
MHKLGCPQQAHTELVSTKRTKRENIEIILNRGRLKTEGEPALRSQVKVDG